jgi:hypothetical protein
MELTEIEETVYTYLTQDSVMPNTPNFLTALEEILVQQLIIHTVMT